MTVSLEWKRETSETQVIVEGLPLLVIQRQLGHANLSITSVYLRGIDNTEIIQQRQPPPRADDLPSQRLTPR